MRKILYSLFLVTAIVACQDLYDAPPQALLEVKLINEDTLSTHVPKVSVYGVDQDSIWIYQVKTDVFRLPLSLEETTSFVLLLDSIADTLTIRHSNELIFESAESGFYHEFKILDVGHSFNQIDDYEVTDSMVTKNWHENIELYIFSLPADDN
ncbi:DUF6452 family protein [uncultured Sunxiuqinia sp.]|uniref:DUF6452 family protein n=1 Tax=uncultured Sunxiuqinia sp. TaxID=1573825 RepID=UPI0030DD6570|tara:strand:- start:43569 stop:44027 length:459 start_codon:yes stop_codon:yes gene_type:complete